MNNTLEVQENSETGELYLHFTPDMLSQMGWHEGDVLEWFNKGDGSFYIQRRCDD